MNQTCAWLPLEDTKVAYARLVFVILGFFNVLLCYVLFKAP